MVANVLPLQIVVRSVSEAPGKSWVWYFRGSVPLTLFCRSHQVLFLEHVPDFREVPLTSPSRAKDRGLSQPLDHRLDLREAKNIEEFWRHIGLPWWPSWGSPHWRWSRIQSEPLFQEGISFAHTEEGHKYSRCTQMALGFVPSEEPQDPGISWGDNLPSAGLPALNSKGNLKEPCVCNSPRILNKALPPTPAFNYATYLCSAFLHVGYKGTFPLNSFFRKCQIMN